MSDPKTHDYTIRCWGHDYTFRPGKDKLAGKMAGWGNGISDGDYLILDNEGSTTRYRVESIRYCADPTDMWFADVRFAPRERLANVDSNDIELQSNKSTT